MWRALSSNFVMNLWYKPLIYTCDSLFCEVVGYSPSTILKVDPFTVTICGFLLQGQNS